MSVRALRYYEEQGLLSSARTPGGQRYYTDDAVERVRFFQFMYAAGLSSARIADMLPCFDTGTTKEQQRRMLAEEHVRIDKRLEELAGARSRLDELILTASRRAG